MPLARRLGLLDAVVVGLGSMVGAGVFSAFAPAAAEAGSALLPALALAAFVAWCNATSTARLAARYPESGGAYVYGTRRLGPAWGTLAGAGFVAGKVASCAAIALTFGAYVLPAHPRPVALVAVAAVTAVDYRGVRRSAAVTRVLVAFTLLVLAAVVAVALPRGTAGNLAVGDVDPAGVTKAAALLFFAFAGYARVATLGEEVRDPERTIPHAVAIALGITLTVYAAVAVATLLALGPDRLAAATSPLADAVAGTAVTPFVRAGAAVATIGSLLALVLGVSRTAFAMARDGRLPRPLAVVHPRHGVPHRATLAVAAAVCVLVVAVDVRRAIGLSSFGVLVYYAVANAAALTLDEGAPPRWVPVAGLAGCAGLALTLALA